MLPIYICEDDGAVLAAQKEYLEKQILIEGYDMEVALCSRHPEDILNAVKAAPRRGIYFLDVELKGEPMDGFSLGQEIRKLDARGFLVYVTSFSDLAFETFRYHLEALDYIVKGNPEKMYGGIRESLAAITERMGREQGELYSAYVDDARDQLEESGYGPLYEGSPYDQIFLISAKTDQPLDTFRDIILEAAEEGA